MKFLGRDSTTKILRVSLLSYNLSLVKRLLLMESNSPVLRLRDHTLPFIESKDFLDSINIASGFRF